MNAVARAASCCVARVCSAYRWSRKTIETRCVLRSLPRPGLMIIFRTSMTQPCFTVLAVCYFTLPDSADLIEPLKVNCGQFHNLIVTVDPQVCMNATLVLTRSLNLSFWVGQAKEAVFMGPPINYNCCSENPVTRHLQCQWRAAWSQQIKVCLMLILWHPFEPDVYFSLSTSTGGRVSNCMGPRVRFHVSGWNALAIMM